MAGISGNISDIKTMVPFADSHKLLVKEHSTDDIVKAIKKHHALHAKDYDQISEKFWEGNAKDTAKKIFGFLKRNISYDIEPEYYQTVKGPGAIINHRYGDCKHYASFINGVICSLERKGYPIHSCYRFVSDTPGREIHHVFAVAKDTGTGSQYWTDPVLNRFNEQPNFYNIKDVDMSGKIGELYAISGVEDTYPGGPRNLPQVWGNSDDQQIGNIFKKIAHGFKVNAENAGKGIKKVAQQAKTLVLKVGIAPARNAFLALLDLNGFNLATRMADAWQHRNAQTVKLWKDAGGDPKRLLSAINNGLKHKAFYHHQAARKVSGSLSDYLRHRRGAAPVRRYHPNFHVESIHHAYRCGPDDAGRLPKVSGIGEPVSLASLVALASALIGVFASVMKKDPQSDQAIAKGAKDAAADMVVNASDAIDMKNATGAATTQDATFAERTGSKLDRFKNLDVPNPTVKATAGEDKDGNPVLNITDVVHPQLENAGRPQPSGRNAVVTQNSDDPDPDPNAIINVPKHLGTDFMKDIIEPIKAQVVNIWQGYKVPIIMTGIGVGIYKYSTRKKRGKR